MNSNDNELMKRFQALTEINRDTTLSQTTSSPAHASTLEQQQQQHETFKHFNDEVSDNLRWNQNEKDKSTEEKLEPMHVEENLSQKMSQLSTQQTKAEKHNEYSLKDIQIDIEKTPDYLTKRNKSFQQMISQVVATIKLNDDKDQMEDFRKIAILIYKIKLIQLYQDLWTNYLKAGVGKLINNQVCSYATNIPIWPKEIKTMAQATTAININQENEYEICFHFVQHYIEELETHLKEYQHKLDSKFMNFQHYSIMMQKQIQTYIEHHLTSLRREIEHEIELIHYDYHIRAIKLVYLSYQPNSFQEQMLKDICVSQYEQETSEQELDFLKQQIIYYTTAPEQSFQQSSIAASCSVIDSIQHPNIRQQLYQQYKQTAEQARLEIFNLYLRSAEQQQDEYKKKHDQNRERMFSACKSLVETEKLPKIMLDLIVLRCQKIDERIKCVYKFKTQFK